MTCLKNYLLYFLFSMSKLFRVKKNTLQNPKAPRILVVSTTGLGDTLWATPAIHSLKKTFPGAFVCVLTSRIGKSLLENNPDINEIYVLHHKGFFQLFGLLKTLRKKRFDTALVFHLSQRFTLPLVYFSNPEKIVGTAGMNKGLDFFLTHSLEKRYEHEIQRRLNICQVIGCTEEETDLKIYVDKEQKETVSSFLSSFEKKKLLIGLHPGAKDLFKQWPPSFFRDLIALLEKNLDATVLLTGDASEKPLGDLIAKESKNAFCVAGKFSLKQTAALLEKLDLYITNDTGPMHMGFAMQTKVLCIFSPTDPLLCGPYKYQNGHILSYPKTCLFCLKKKCREPFCMRQISVEEVFFRAQAIVQKNSCLDSRFCQSATLEKKTGKANETL